MWESCFARLFAYLYSQLLDQHAAYLIAQRVLREPGAVGSVPDDVRLFRSARSALQEWRHSRSADPAHPPPARLAEHRSLARALHRLSREDQELLSLAFDAMLDYDQIALVLGMAPSKVADGMLRALEELRRIVQRSPSR
jgi:DNA-directed RNA polymerase specialized sigma24 family protein